jgi:hypothetical protein
MKIGILEIMPIGHYTLVDSVVRIFVSDKNNQIYLFLHRNGENDIQNLVKSFPNQIQLRIWDGNSKLESLFKSVNQCGLDKIYMITFEKHFKEFYSFDFNSQVNIFIHNVDEWFHADVKYILYHIFKNISSFNEFIYRTKVNIIYKNYRQKIIKKLLNTGGRFLVLNSFLRNELIKFLPESKIDIIPFSIYNDSLVDKSQNNKLLKICIPGMVSEIRRDYYAIINLISNNLDFFSKNIEFEFLGGVANKEGGQNIIKEVKNLIDKGAKIICYDQQLVPVGMFDERLTHNDIILGNIIVSVDKYSKYGKTKETGIPFTMIRAAKPGILPIDYNVINELESSTIRFRDYKELLDILINLVNHRDNLLSLKQEALKNSLKFTPSGVYQKLMLKPS